MYLTPPEAVNSIDSPFCMVADSGVMVILESADSVSHPVKARQAKTAKPTAKKIICEFFICQDAIVSLH